MFCFTKPRTVANLTRTGADWKLNLPLFLGAQTIPSSVPQLANEDGDILPGEAFAIVLVITLFLSLFQTEQVVTGSIQHIFLETLTNFL